MTILSLIVLRSPDPEALLPFYRALGLEWKREQHGSGPFHFACEVGGVVLEIYPPKKNGNEADFAAPMLGFNVDPLEETLTRLREIGVEAGAIYESVAETSCTVRDFDGRVVHLVEVAVER